MKQTQEKLVTIAEFNNYFNANVALTKLHANDIPAILNNETTAAVFGVPIAPYDAIRLLVFERDADRARSIIADTEA